MAEKNQSEEKPERDEMAELAERAPHEGHHPGCRCKESTEKTLPEILKTMARDLAFWKKDK